MSGGRWRLSEGCVKQRGIAVPKLLTCKTSKTRML